MANTLIREMLKSGLKNDMSGKCGSELCVDGGCSNPGDYCANCYCAVCIKASPKLCQPKIDLTKLAKAASKSKAQTHKPKKRPMPEATPDGLNWGPHDRNLVKGDIIRTRVGNQDHPKYGQYCYAVCSGGGFGCNPSSMGNAIFVDHASFNVQDVIAKKDAPTDQSTFERWEAFWGIQVLKS